MFNFAEELVLSLKAAFEHIVKHPNDGITDASSQFHPLEGLLVKFPAGMIPPDLLDARNRACRAVFRGFFWEHPYREDSPPKRCRPEDAHKLNGLDAQPS